MITRNLAFAFLVLPLVACDKTDECAELEKLTVRYEEVGAQMRARAGLHAQATKRAAQSEERTKALLKKLGLDKSETEMHAALQERAVALGARLDRGTREVAIDGEQNMTEKQTLWTFELAAKDSAEAVSQARQLAGSPPLFRYVALLGDGKSWRFRLAAAQVVQMNLDEIKPVAAPKRASPEDIKSEFGFCGAGKLRSRLAELDREIAKLEVKAAETTVALPKSASWAGLHKRLSAQHAEEAHAREILDTLLTAAVTARVPIKATGVEGGVVILEMRGGPKERKRFQEKLSPSYLQSLRPAENPRPGLIRYMMVNRGAAKSQKPASPGHEGHGHD